MKGFRLSSPPEATVDLVVVLLRYNSLGLLCPPCHFFLGEDTADADGRYIIGYEPLAGVDSINLRVTVFSAEGKALHDSNVIRGAKRNGHHKSQKIPPFPAVTLPTDPVIYSFVPSVSLW